ncbi:MAG: DinB family protein [Chloroflexota bacterium]
MPEKLTLFMYQAWADLDHAVDGLTPEQATTRYDGGSSIAWTVGHVTTQVDSWINLRFQGLAPHPAFDRAIFRTGGNGEATDWPGILVGVRDVRASARRFLESDSALHLDRVIPYDGAVAHLRSTGLRLSFALMSIAAHHFQHVGEIITIRSRLGHVQADAQGWGRAFS